MLFYALASCDTSRKALKSLRAAGHDPQVVDVRDSGIDADLAAAMLAALGEKVVNRASTTWRELPEAERALPPAEILHRHPVVMKRPVIRQGDSWTMGWDARTQAQLGL